MVKAWVNEDGYREEGYRERKLAELEAKSKSKKTQVTKDMTEKDIMRTWDYEDEVRDTRRPYTDEAWRAECEQRRMNLRVKAENAVKANQKQYGGDHYKNMGVEPWDVVDSWPLEQRIGAYRHGALKYLMRMGSKDEQLQEIKKCGHYIEKLIEVLSETND